MEREYIKNFDKTIVGIVETKDNGDQVFRDFPSQEILGFYRKAQDHTTDFYFRILSKGNTGISLIYQRHPYK